MMNKRVLASLAPLLAIMALTVVPAAAQAEPHWYLSGNILAEGKKMTVKTNGKLVFSIPGTTIRVSCTVTDAEVLLNPKGGGAGVVDRGRSARSGRRSSSAGAADRANPAAQNTKKRGRARLTKSRILGYQPTACPSLR